MAPPEEAVGEPKITIQLVNDWIGTVLNPLIWGVSRELDVMSRSWSWRRYTEDFAHLDPAVKLVGYYFWPNCEQLCQHEPKLAQKIETYDQALDQLRTRCIEAYRALLQEPEFIDLVRELSAEAGSEDEDLPRYLAEHTINGIEELPTDYTTADIWNPNARLFLDLSARFAPTRAVHEVGAHVRQAAEDLRMLCTALRNSLANEFGVPRVPSAYI